MNIQSTTGIQIDQVTTTEDLEKLHPEWADLWARCPKATPFQSPDWLLPLWHHLGAGALWMLCVRREGDLIGLAPLFVWTEPDSRRRVLFLGTPIADYADLLFEPLFEDAAATAILFHLREHSHRWDVLDFQQLRADSALLRAPPHDGWVSRVTVQEVCPALDLPPSGQPLSATVPERMLANLSYYRQRLEKLGPFILERARLDNFDELFDAFLHLHRARWKSRGQEGVLSDRRLREFHRESAFRMLLSGMLRLYALRSNDRIVAAIYGFAHRRRAYYYLSGFDPALRSVSPGTLMLGCALEEARAEACEQFDFLRGREPYKFMWGAKARLNYRRQFAAA